nr:hypothetical protein [Tanacetum cinerariifolium]
MEGLVGGGRRWEELGVQKTKVVTRWGGGCFMAKGFYLVTKMGDGAACGDVMEVLGLGCDDIMVFWTTAKAKNINEEEQLHAKVDGEKVVIFKASIKRDLRFGDEGSKEISRLKKRVKRLEKKRSQEHELKGLYKVRLSARVESSDEESLGKEDASKQERKLIDIDVDKGLTLINETIEDHGRINNKETLDTDVFNDEEILVESVDVAEQAKEIIADKDLIDDITLAKALMEIKLTAASTRPKAKSIVMQEPTETPTTTTIPMSSKVQDKGKVVKDKAKLTQESSSKRAGDDLDQERSKKQKLKDDKESEELKRCLEIIPDDGDDVTIDATPLSIKTSIID